MISSPITKNECCFYCNKDGVDYYKCIDTGTLFTLQTLDQSEKVGGEAEEERNNTHNNVRINRIKKIDSNAVVLDFGCGHGYFVNCLRNAGISADGYDPFDESFFKMPSGLFTVVTLIEVIEHLQSPFKEIQLIANKLINEGILYIETSFSNWVDENHPYLNPKLGHCTIFSHKGLDILLARYGFEPLQHISRNARLYKISKKCQIKISRYMV